MIDTETERYWQGMLLMETAAPVYCRDVNVLAELLTPRRLEWHPMMCDECGVRPATREYDEDTRNFNAFDLVCSECYCTCCYAPRLDGSREIDALWKLSGRHTLSPRQKKAEESFWESMQKSAEPARSMPSWMKGGINLSERSAGR